MNIENFLSQILQVCLSGNYYERTVTYITKGIREGKIKIREVNQNSDN